jgi:hypothetical protein
MRYFYDSEFLENGSIIDLISIGIVNDEGKEYYAVNSDMPLDSIRIDKWLMANVWPSLPLRGRKKSTGYVNSGSDGVLDTRSVLVKPKWVIANEVREFLLQDGEPELWADYAAYDHVVLCQLWGRMMNLPKGIPMFTHDLQQLLAGREWAEPEREGSNHNALDDARHLKRTFDTIARENVQIDSDHDAALRP